MGAPSLTQEELHPEVLPLQSAFTGCNSVLQSAASAGCDGGGTVAEVATPTNAWASAGAGIRFAVMVTCSMPLLCCFKLFLIRVPYRWNAVKLAVHESKIPPPHWAISPLQT